MLRCPCDRIFAQTLADHILAHFKKLVPCLGRLAVTRLLKQIGVVVKPFGLGAHRQRHQLALIAALIHKAREQIFFQLRRYVIVYRGNHAGLCKFRRPDAIADNYVNRCSAHNAGHDFCIALIIALYDKLGFNSFIPLQNIGGGLNDAHSIVINNGL